MRIISLSCLALFFVGCQQPKDENKATFEMQSFALESQPGCVSDTVACATFKVEYPHFIEMDTTVEQAIMERMEFWLSGGIDGEAKSISVLGNDFIRDFSQFVTDMPDYGMGWNYNARVSVLLATDSLISLQIDIESFTGGAHGSYTTNYVNVDPVTGTPYLLDSFLRPGYQEVLNQLGERDFRLQRELEERSSLEDAGFNFPENQFQLNDNYGFRKEGIVFFFNSYEIAAYAEGPTEILVPYEELRGWYK